MSIIDISTIYDMMIARWAELSSGGKTESLRGDAVLPPCFFTRLFSGLAFALRAGRPHLPASARFFDKLRLPAAVIFHQISGIVTGKDSFRQNAAVARIISLCKGARRALHGDAYFRAFQASQNMKQLPAGRLTSLGCPRRKIQIVCSSAGARVVLNDAAARLTNGRGIVYTAHPASAVFGRVLLQLAVLLGERRFVSVEADASASALSLSKRLYRVAREAACENTCSALLYIQPAAALCGAVLGKSSVFKLTLYPRQKQAAAKIARLVFRKRNPMERGNRICSAAYINTCGHTTGSVLADTAVLHIQAAFHHADAAACDICKIAAGIARHLIS